MRSRAACSASSATCPPCSRRASRFAACRPRSRRPARFARSPSFPSPISMLVVIFAMIELIVLPGVYTALASRPADRQRRRARHDRQDRRRGRRGRRAARRAHDQRGTSQLTGEQWQAGWILSASLLTKIWIDVFIGVWAFVLAIVWITRSRSAPAPSASARWRSGFASRSSCSATFVRGSSYLAIADAVAGRWRRRSTRARASCRARCARCCSC